MKTINAVVKVLTALATIAGAVYIIATYGDQIVQWAKELLAKCPQSPAAETVTEEVPVEAVEEVVAAAEEAAVSEVTEPVAVEEAPVETAPEATEENAPVADEADFEG